MKLLLPLMMVLMMAAESRAQLSAGSVAPDWTLKDINGNTHRLYDYLNAGKTVILDFSATWCGPCWFYHNSKALEDLYTEYGPEGTDEVMVFFIEGDVATTNADLHGTGSNTMGDWVTGTKYPIIDLANNTVAGAYKIGYFPTIYSICPNRFITEIGQLSINELHAATKECPAPASLETQVNLLQYEGNRVACSGGIPVKVRIQNYGTQNLTEATFYIKNSNGDILAEKNWTGNLGTYDFETVSFDPIEVSGETPISIYAVANGITTPEAEYIDETLSNVYQVAKTKFIKLELQTDLNGQETSWKLTNGAGNEQQSGKDLDPNKLYNPVFILQDNQCYNFTIFDKGGNGLSGNGYYKLSDNKNNILKEGKVFGDVEATGFLIQTTTGLSDLFQGDVQLTPNPAKDQARIEMDLVKNTALTIRIADWSGKIVRDLGRTAMSAGYQQVSLDIAGLVPATYQVILQGSEGVETLPLVIVQ